MLAGPHKEGWPPDVKLVSSLHSCDRSLDQSLSEESGIYQSITCVEYVTLYHVLGSANYLILRHHYVSHLHETLCLWL